MLTLEGRGMVVLWWRRLKFSGLGRTLDNSKIKVTLAKFDG